MNHSFLHLGPLDVIAGLWKVQEKGDSPRVQPTPRIPLSTGIQTHSLDHELV